MDKEDVWQKFDKHTRYAIRKAEKEGVVVSDATSLDDIREMYELHVARTKDIKGWVPLPYMMFEGLWKSFKPGKDAKFLIARYKGKPIAESIFLCFRDNVHYFNNASLKEYQHLNANSLLIWRAIEWAMEGGHRHEEVMGNV